MQSVSIQDRNSISYNRHLALSGYRCPTEFMCDKPGQLGKQSEGGGDKNNKRYRPVVTM